MLSRMADVTSAELSILIISPKIVCGGLKLKQSQLIFNGIYKIGQRQYV
jgi:hypothetical protein